MAVEKIIYKKQSLTLWLRDDGWIVAQADVGPKFFLAQTTDCCDLINALCGVPQVKELIGTVPLVLYFGSEADRDEMAALVHNAKPGMRAIKV